jgi:hypothetical protein
MVAEGLTVDPFTLFTDQAVNSLANIGWDTDSVERAHLRKAGLDGVDVHALVATGDVVPAVLIKHVGLYTTGGDSIAGDALLTAVHGEGTSETLHSGLGAGVQGVIGDAGHLSGDGRCEDDAAALAAVLQAVLSDEELASAVKVKDLVKELRGDLGLLAPDLHAGVRNDKVDMAIVFYGFGEKSRNLLGLGDVCL